MKETAIKLYSIYDKNKKIYLQPFAAKTSDDAIRFLKEVIDDNPLNYDVCFIGYFIEETGKLKPRKPISAVYEKQARCEK